MLNEKDLEVLIPAVESRIIMLKRKQSDSSEVTKLQVTLDKLRIL